MLPLLAEGQDKKAQDPVILRLQVSGNPDHHFRLPYIDSQGPVDPIPPTENHRKIRIRLLTDRRVMDTMHARRNDNPVEPSLNPNRQA